GAPLGSLDTWLKNAKETPGSWWPDWRDWVKGHDAEKVPARKIGNAEYPPIEDAPGRYVRMKS
ncbi:MAG TPA: hypothetical protein VET25_09490, partial [Aestuariivirgaceae bacterium]|nr:hypothetical protein [Aestuariivirgaceae bacterium]